MPSIASLSLISAIHPSLVTWDHRETPFLKEQAQTKAFGEYSVTDFYDDLMSQLEMSPPNPSFFPPLERTSVRGSMTIGRRIVAFDVWVRSSDFHHALATAQNEKAATLLKGDKRLRDRALKLAEGVGKRLEREEKEGEDGLGFRVEKAALTQLQIDLGLLRSVEEEVQRLDEEDVISLENELMENWLTDLVYGGRRRTELGNPGGIELFERLFWSKKAALKNRSYYRKETVKALKASSLLQADFETEIWRRERFHPHQQALVARRDENGPSSSLDNHPSSEGSLREDPSKALSAAQASEASKLDVASRALGTVVSWLNAPPSSRGGSSAFEKDFLRRRQGQIRTDASLMAVRRGVRQAKRDRGAVWIKALSLLNSVKAGVESTNLSDEALLKVLVDFAEGWALAGKIETDLRLRALSPLPAYVSDLKGGFLAVLPWFFEHLLEIHRVLLKIKSLSAPQQALVLDLLSGFFPDEALTEVPSMWVTV